MADLTSQPAVKLRTARADVVAEVPVAFMKVKFCRVEEAVARRLANVPRPVEVRLPPVA